MQCANNFSELLPHPASEMSWQRFTLTFSQPSAITGNYSSSIYFEDSNNGSSPPLTLIFTILEFPCWNGASCARKFGFSLPYIGNFSLGFNFAEFGTSLKLPKIDTAKNKTYFTSSLIVLEIEKIGLSENLIHLPSVTFAKISRREKFSIYGIQF